MKTRGDNMNKPADSTTKAKGISVDSFWRRIKDKTAPLEAALGSDDSPGQSDPNSKLLKERRDETDPQVDWEDRFNAWLDRA